jgi:Ohr subfamily peroxiredoxin
MLIDAVLYQAQVKATGGRDGRAVSADGVLDVRLSTPRELGGAGGQGTNPEQLFAAGYGACFLSAMKYVAARDTLAIPPEISVESTVGIGAVAQGFGLEVELKIALPGLSDREAASLVNKAQEVCP